MNILITGIAGLIGSRFAQYLIENTEHQVYGVDALQAWGNEEQNIPEKAIYWKKDISTQDISFIFEKYNIDIVYHFAAYAAEGLSPFMRQFNYANNVGATVNVINNCIKYKVKRLVYTSSMSVYGNGIYTKRQFDENDALAPIDPYGISKMACECDIRVAGEQHGLDWCIIRPHNVYGANQNVNDRYRNVLGIWMHQIYNGDPIMIYGDGEQTRAFTEVSNILPCLLKAGVDEQCSKQIINLGGTVEYTINQAADMLLDITGTDKKVYKEARHEVKFAVPTFQKSIDMLDYKEAIDFYNGLKNMWQWAKEGRIKEWYKWQNFEIKDKIYSYWNE